MSVTDNESLAHAAIHAAAQRDEYKAEQNAFQAGVEWARTQVASVPVAAPPGSKCQVRRIANASGTVHEDCGHPAVEWIGYPACAACIATFAHHEPEILASMRRNGRRSPPPPSAPKPHVLEWKRDDEGYDVASLGNDFWIEAGDRTWGLHWCDVEIEVGNATDRDSAKAAVIAATSKWLREALAAIEWSTTGTPR
jgi:hypothetical protein